MARFNNYPLFICKLVLSQITSTKKKKKKKKKKIYLGVKFLKLMKLLKVKGIF